MPLEIMTGLAVLHGVQDNGTAITISGYATFVIDKLSARHNFDSKFFQDSNGYDVCGVATNENMDITLDFTPTGTTRTLAAAGTTFPIPLASVTLTNVKMQTALTSTPATKIFDGSYLYTGGASIDLTKNDFGKISGLMLKKWANVAQNTSMVTTVAS